VYYSKIFSCDQFPETHKTEESLQDLLPNIPVASGDIFPEISGLNFPVSGS